MPYFAIIQKRLFSRVGDMKLIKDVPGKQSTIISLDDPTEDEISEDQFPFENTLCHSPEGQIDSTLRLFNLTADPSESNDLILVHPDIAQELLKKLDSYEATMIPPHLEPGNERGNPNRFGGVWSTGWCESKP